MRGGQIHEYIIEQLDRVFQQHGFRTARQVVARSGSRLSFVDLVVEDASGALLCVEVETGGGGGRVWRDLDKAPEAGCSLDSGPRPTGQRVDSPTREATGRG